MSLHFASAQRFILNPSLMYEIHARLATGQQCRHSWTQRCRPLLRSYTSAPATAVICGTTEEEKKHPKLGSVDDAWRDQCTACEQLHWPLYNRPGASSCAMRCTVFQKELMCPNQMEAKLKCYTLSLCIYSTLDLKFSYIRPFLWDVEKIGTTHFANTIIEWSFSFLRRREWHHVVSFWRIYTIAPSLKFAQS